MPQVNPIDKGLVGLCSKLVVLGVLQGSMRDRKFLGSPRDLQGGKVSPKPENGHQGTTCIQLTSAGCTPGRPDLKRLVGQTSRLVVLGAPQASTDAGGSWGTPRLLWLAG